MGKKEIIHHDDIEIKDLTSLFKKVVKKLATATQGKLQLYLPPNRMRLQQEDS